MFIIVAGAGTVGQALAIKLAKSSMTSPTKHNVAVIEQSREICDNLYTRHGITAYVGSGTSIATLRDAGIEKADVAVATMHSDANNLAFTVLAKHFKVPRIIVRMRDTDYEETYRTAGATQILNLVDMLLVQLTLEIVEPNVRTVATFGEGKGSIFIFSIPDDWGSSGATVKEIAMSPQFPDECLITGIYHQKTKDLDIPRGDSQVFAGDQIFLTAPANLQALRAAKNYFSLKAPKKED